MVDLTRRKTVIGLGLLATGSGATFTSAAFTDSTAADADLRVVVDQNLTVRPGPAFNNADQKADFTNNTDFFDGQDINDTADGGGAFDPNGDDESLPLASATGENDNLSIKVAVPLGSSATFSELLEIENELDSSVDIGISYDRNASPNQYGEDVDAAGGGLATNVAQRAYQFKVNSTGNLISPDPADNDAVDDSGGNSPDIGNNDDLPADTVSISPGSSKKVDLVIDTSTDSGVINDEADINSNVFGFQRDTVQLINGLTIGTIDNPTSADPTG